MQYITRQAVALYPSFPDEASTSLCSIPVHQNVRVKRFEGPYAYIQCETSGHCGYIDSGYLAPAHSIDEASSIVRIFDHIYTYDQMRIDASHITDTYPNIVQLQIIGHTPCQRDLISLVVGHGDLHLLFHASMHGREYITSAMLMKQLESLLRASLVDPSIDQLLSKVTLHIIPMVNPDGIMISQVGLASITDSAMRQVVHDLSSQHPSGLEHALRHWKSNALGCDLNQNFDYGWEYVRSTSSAGWENFKGTSPHSEPESQALAAYSCCHPIQASFSYHATGSYVIWDIGQTDELRHNTMKLAESAARSTDYIIDQHDGTFSSVGGYKDWMIGALGIPSLTLELANLDCPNDLAEYPIVWVRTKDLMIDLIRTAIQLFT